MVNNRQSAFEKCGVQYLQNVDTPNGVGIVQGILNTKGALSVIVSHKPDTLPPEMVPGPCMWKLMYYEPTQVTPVKRK